MVKDAGLWEVEPERTASEFDVRYYGKLLEKAWEGGSIRVYVDGGTFSAQSGDQTVLGNS